MTTVLYAGGKYTGEVDEKNFPNGQGSITYESGDSYKGSWQHGKPHGKGTAKGKIDEKKAQEYKKNLAETGASYFNELLTSVGDYSYEGEWKNGKMHGQGTFTFPNGDRYEGEWENNVASGAGIYFWKESGDKYQGSWKNMTRNGNGSYCFKDGTKFDGTWLNDKRHGKGVESYVTGDRYEGYWFNDKMHGKGYYYSVSAALAGSGSGTIKKKTGSTSSPSSLKVFTIFECVYEHGVRKAENKMESTPTTLPEPPMELREPADRLLDEFDQKDVDFKFSNDDPFVEALLTWNDQQWKSLEEMFVPHIRCSYEVDILKNFLSKVSKLDEVKTKTTILRESLAQLKTAMETDRETMKGVLKKVLRAMKEEEDMPPEESNEDILKMKLEVKITAYEAALTEAEEDTKAAQTILEQMEGDVSVKVKEFQARVSDLERKAVRNSSTIATAKLQSSSTPTTVQTDNAQVYNPVRDAITLHLSRLKNIVRVFNVSPSIQAAEAPTCEKKQVVDKAVAKYRSCLAELHESITQVKINPYAIIDRYNALVAQINADKTLLPF